MRWIVGASLAALAAASCGGEDRKARRDCASDADCDSGVCFQQQCYQACTSRDECTDDEICVWRTAEGRQASLCLLASDLAGCVEPADCQDLLRLAACEDATCTVDGLCDTVPRAGCLDPDACAGDACGDGSDGDTTDGSRLTSTIIHTRFPLPQELANVPVHAGVSNPFDFRLELDEVVTWFQVAEGTIDVQATLAFATFQPTVVAPVDDLRLTVGLRVGTGVERATVCSTGEPYGPSDLALDASTLQLAGSAEPATWTATDATLATVNSGVVTGCLDVVPPVDGTWTLSELALGFRLATVCTDPPLDLAGTWTGTYACTNWLGETSSPEDGTVTLSVTQDGRQASYTDEGGATYDGVVCGGAFSFAGGKAPAPGSLDGYFESGRLEMAADGKTATKASTWHGAYGWGTCTDQLTRQP